jgi:catechol 2,3-dioxygenase-like lactoylglutathione lyase family enzyme
MIVALHGLDKLTIGVPNRDDTIAYYSEFGLEHCGDGRFRTRNGGEQLQIATAPTRRLLRISIAADHQDDVNAAAARLTARGLPVTLDEGRLQTVEPITGVIVEVTQRPRIIIEPAPAPTPYNLPAQRNRTGRAPALSRTEPVRPRRLGHVVVASTDMPTTMKFFTEGVGLKISDYMGDQGAFLRCSTDHHNVLVMAAPVNFMHHTSWQVDDVDEIGRGAHAMLEDHPERHIWGLGRHFAGGNFFWYLRDPAGNFSEYYADMDDIPEDQLWSPEVMQGLQGLYSWGPPPPPSFVNPDDLAELMAGAHSTAV